MSLREIDRAPSDMSTNSSTNTSFVMEETTTVDSVEYTKNKIYKFLDSRGDDYIISSMNDRFYMVNQILRSFTTIGLENINCVLIATLLSVFNEFNWDNFSFNINSFTNVSSEAIKDINEMLYLTVNKSESRSESYKLIPMYVSILIDSSRSTIMNIVNNVNEKELYSELRTYINLINNYKIEIKINPN